MKIAITLTCYRRYDYLYEVLDSIKTSFTYCNMSLPIYASIDYFDESIPKLIKKIAWTQIQYSINKPSYGCNKNTKNAIIMGLKDNDAIIHLEDDTVLAKDAIKYFVDKLQLYKDDKSIICVGGYNKTHSIDNADLNKTKKHKRFVCWGCAFWKNKSDIIMNNWTNELTRTNNTGSWDTHINSTLFENDNHDYYQIVPEISRIQNIGAVDGTWVPNEIFHANNHRSPFTSDDLL